MYKKIIFPIDVSSKNSWSENLDQVLDIVKAFESKLYLMTVIPDHGISLVEEYFPKGWIKEIRHKAKEALEKIALYPAFKNLDVECVVDRGNIYQAVIRKSVELEADLIALPAHRPELRDYLLGPNTARIVRHAGISVLVLRG